MPQNCHFYWAKSVLIVRGRTHDYISTEILPKMLLSICSRSFGIFPCCCWTNFLDNYPSVGGSSPLKTIKIQL